MFLIFGLGNPGKDYAGTRHNAGFETMDKLAYDNRIEINKFKRRAFVGDGIIANQKCVLIKPQTFMNLSGECVRDTLEFYKAPPMDIIVVYDDTSLDVGEIRVRKQGSAGGHNGMKNIIYHLETDIFTRVRIGIGEKPSGWDLADYVTSRFKKEEMDDIIEGISKASDAVTVIIREGADAAMNVYNTKRKRSEDIE